MPIKELLLLFLTFFKIGLFTFGGGYAMIPMIEEEVLKQGWLDSIDTLVDFVAISESTPGPFAVNIATFIGYQQQGILGAAVATIGVVLPSFVIISIIARFYKRFSTNSYVNGFLGGVKPVIVGILGAVGLGLVLRGTLHTDILNLAAMQIDLIAIAIFVVVLVISRILPKINPIYLILISAVLGISLYSIF
ncbi:MAG: chromate transporter [Acholeplasmataceae bacterium]|nr:chromate transporter [Acholeplasmataceae bacterium]